MNSDHAPTAEEQVPPLESYRFKTAEEALHLPLRVQLLRLEHINGELCDSHNTLLIDAANQQRRAEVAEAQLAEKDAKITQLAQLVERMAETSHGYFQRADAASAKLRAVSDALDEKPVTVFHVGELEYYLRSEIDVPLTRIRAIVEGK